MATEAVTEASLTGSAGLRLEAAFLPLKGQVAWRIPARKTADCKYN